MFVFSSNPLPFVNEVLLRPIVTLKKNKNSITMKFPHLTLKVKFFSSTHLLQMFFEYRACKSLSRLGINQIIKPKHSFKCIRSLWLHNPNFANFFVAHAAFCDYKFAKFPFRIPQEMILADLKNKVE